MKLKIILVLFTLSRFFGASAQTGSVKGKIIDGQGALPYSTIMLTPTTLGGTSNEKGFYEIKNVPAGTYQLTVTCIGYKPQHIQVKVEMGVTVTQNVELKADANSLNEVVVTGVSRATQIRENPQTLLAISSKQIETSSENNTIDAISKNAPGLQTVKTGPNVSKPFINGLGYNRVLTLYDGLRVETQQWGDEHGVPMDDYIIERAEVIEGPASLMYGSDAIAGVLSLFPAIPKDTDKVLHGRFLSEYQSNNGLVGNNLSLTYGSSQWDFALRVSERIARSYTNPVDGRV